MKPLDQISVRGFKSIQNLEDFELRGLNVLIGANGAGKSNFVEVFRMLTAAVRQSLSTYVEANGGADQLLFGGPKVTEEIAAHFVFGSNEYRFTLVPTVDSRLIFQEEAQKYVKGSWSIIGMGEKESRLVDVKDREGMRTKKGVGHYVYNTVKDWVVYHFHDTGKTAGVRRGSAVEDRDFLRPDARNLAAFLKKLRESYSRQYGSIRDVVRMALPFFDDFRLDERVLGDRTEVVLSWQQKGSDFPMQPYHLSDGSIRFICLVVALLQPDPPSTVLIDEPELGLHPYAIELLAEVMRAFSNQLIVSTQSASLVDCFEPSDVVVVSREEGQTVLERLDEDTLAGWLEDYSLGQLWRKGVIGGGPVHE